MARLMALSLGLLCTVLLAGCPYSSPVPLAEPGDIALDAGLFGNWIGVDTDGDSLQISVFPFNQREYYVETRNHASPPARYRVFPFQVEKNLFLHVNELSADAAPEGYAFARYALSGDSDLSLRLVGDKIIPKNLTGSPDDLRVFLKEHVNDPGLDDEESGLVLHRKK